METIEEKSESNSEKEVYDINKENAQKPSWFVFF